MHHQDLLSTLGKIPLVAVGLTTALLVAGCAGVSVPVEGPQLDTSVPDWWTGAVQKVDGVVQGYGQGRSTEMRVARNIARLGATNEIAQFQRQENGGSGKNMDLLEGTAEADVIQAYRQASQIIWNEALVGVQQANQAIFRDGNMYIVYILMEQDPKAVLAAYEAQMKSQQAAYARFRATEVFKEMEEDIRLMEERRRRNRR